MERESELQRLAHQRIESGRLPKVAPPHVWGGKGDGARCALCDKTIDAEDTELEIVQRVDGRARSLHFHVLCYSEWQLACKEYARPKNEP